MLYNITSTAKLRYLIRFCVENNVCGVFNLRFLSLQAMSLKKCRALIRRLFFKPQGSKRMLLFFARPGWIIVPARRVALCRLGQTPRPSALHFAKKRAATRAATLYSSFSGTSARGSTLVEKTIWVCVSPNLCKSLMNSSRSFVVLKRQVKICEYLPVTQSHPTTFLHPLT